MDTTKLNTVKELRDYFNSFGLNNEYPKSCEVNAALYGRICQATFNHLSDINGMCIIFSHLIQVKVTIGLQGGIFFKGVELILKENK